MSNPNQILRSQTRGRAENGRLAFPAAPFPHGIQIIFKKYDYDKMIVQREAGGFRNVNDRSGGATETDNLVIELPMPTTLVDATGLAVNGFEKSILESFVADALAPALSGGTDPLDTLKSLYKFGEEGAESVVGGIQKMFSDPSGFKGDMGNAASNGGRLAGFFLRNTLDAAGLGQKALGNATGSAINPHATLSFEGVNLRNFQFNWTLYPDSLAEAEDIKKIVRSIKRVILPETSGVTIGADGGPGQSFARAFLKYPSVAFINLLGVDESAFVKFKACMVGDITIDYGGSGAVVIAEGGKPQGIKLSISFKEMEIQTAEDFAEPSDGDNNTNEDAADTPPGGN